MQQRWDRWVRSEDHVYRGSCGVLLLFTATCHWCCDRILRNAEEKNKINEILRLRARELAKVSDEKDEGVKIRLIVFLLNSEWYGIEDIEAREILRSARIYSVPKAPAYVNGVVNVRGDIIPVIDLAKFLGLKANEKAPSISAKIIIGGKDTVTIGLSVDHLEDIIEVEQAALQTIDLLGEEAKFIKGKLEWDKKVITVLNMAQLIALPGNNAVN